MFSLLQTESNILRRCTEKVAEVTVQVTATVWAFFYFLKNFGIKFTLLVLTVCLAYNLLTRTIRAHLRKR
jgi:hypothetical protein